MINLHEKEVLCSIAIDAKRYDEFAAHLLKKCDNSKKLKNQDFS